MSLLRTLVKTARPGLACVPVRTIRAKPEYYHPADPDPDEEQRFNEQFGLAEPIPDTWGISKNEPWCWMFDPLYKAKTRVSHCYHYFMDMDRAYKILEILQSTSVIDVY